VLVSVDGLRSDALLALQPRRLPAFTRLLGGASTLNARCDPDYFDHAAQPHLDAHRPAGARRQRPRLGAERRGGRGRDACTRTRASTWPACSTSCTTALAHRAVGRQAQVRALRPQLRRLDGAPDALAPDDGRDKLDDYVFSEKTEEIGDGVVRELGDARRRPCSSCTFRDHDLTAHAAAGT